MKQQRRRTSYLLPAALLVALAGCTAIPKPDGQPAPTPPSNPTPPPPAPAPVMSKAWEERSLDQGAWRYDAANRTATFAQSGAPILTLRCAGNLMQIVTDRLQADGKPLAVDLRTHSGSVRLHFEAQGPHGSIWSTGTGDNRLDQIAFSRGRFALEATNGRALTLPVHAEIGRVIEDCRG